MGSFGYIALAVAGIAVSALIWTRAIRRDPRLALIYLVALAGALLGAKGVYFLAEGWMDLSQPDWVPRLLAGKTLLGGLLFGYIAVELAKRFLGYHQPTGDWFALTVPLSLMLGRLGCWFQGCCPGTILPPAWYTVTDSAGASRWPAVPVELGFNAVAWVVLLFLNWRRTFPGQGFHLYLMAYGAFRFAHEFLRDTPRLSGSFSGYHWTAVAVFGLGALGYRRRALESRPLVQDR